MLRLENISLNIGSFEMKDISFEIQQGEYFVILGISGVGKTILLESIAGLLKIDSGNIYLRGKNITREKIQKRNIGIVYQEADLFPHLSVYENIAYPLKSKKEKEVKEKVIGAAEKVGIMDKLNRKPDTLSGGEYQRAAIARSLAAGSDIFLLDEPLSSLDSKAKSELRSLLRNLNRSGITMLHVTHDYEEAVSLASKIGIMENGRLVHIASPEEIFRHPKSEFVAHFTGVRNFFRGELKTIAQSDLKEFAADNIKIYTLTDLDDGEAYLTVQPGDINISLIKESGSSRNHFNGIIKDIITCKVGLEIVIDAGGVFIASISKEAVKELNLEIGKEVWISFKASSCKIYK